MNISLEPDLDYSQSTLKHYYEKAGVSPIPEWADEIFLLFYDSEEDKYTSFVPRPHQLSGLREALKRPRFGIYDDPGTGKTAIIQAYCILQCYLGNKCVVVMPPKLLGQFEESLNITFYGIEKRVSFYLLEESVKKSRELISEWKQSESLPDMLGMSYEKMRSLNHELKDAGYVVFVADEAHKLKNTSTTTHKRVDEFLGTDINDSAALLATGTPIPNEMIDTLGLISLTNPGAYAGVKDFKRKHEKYAYNVDGEKVLIGYRGYPLIRYNLYKNARRVTKSEVFSMKHIDVQQVPVILHPKHKALYDKLVEERMLEYKGELINAVQAASLRMKCLRIVTRPDVFTEEIFPNHVYETVDELIDSFGVTNPENTKLVMFANFVESVEGLAEHLKDLNPALIYGRISNTERERKKFMADRTCRVVICHPKSGGAGFNFQSVSDFVLFAEPTSVPGDFRQCFDRIRAGQNRPTTIRILRVRGTVSPNLTRNMLRKESEASEVTMERNQLFAQLMGN